MPVVRALLHLPLGSQFRYTHRPVHPVVAHADFTPVASIYVWPSLIGYIILWPIPSHAPCFVQVYSFNCIRSQLSFVTYPLLLQIVILRSSPDGFI
jgi:hypothetical protein